MAMGAVTMRRSITGLRTSLNTTIESWKRPGTPKPSAAIQKAAEDLLKKVDDTCKKFGTPQQCGERTGPLGSAGPTLVYTPPPVTQRITQLLGSIENYTAAPSAAQLEQIKVLQGLLASANTEARDITQKDLPMLNKMMNDAGVPHITAPGLGRPAATASPGEED